MRNISFSAFIGLFFSVVCGFYVGMTAIDKVVSGCGFIVVGLSMGLVINDILNEISEVLKR